ncbi:cathecol O-methyltransferase 1-like [Spinacia oleracea]|uniref:Cathecol O-methyltransferase 1-like n=1 Tax=Spinacia oleracea TaxID=3562 RepID=A0ABM3R3Q4_SPIOL|nr:cathecol O-methyltransferase 1-like [Spinacia oleracea]
MNNTTYVDLQYTRYLSLSMGDHSSMSSKANNVNEASSDAFDNTVRVLIDVDDNDDEAENFVLAAQLVQSSVLPWVLHTAMELDLFGIIARAGRQLSATEISAQLPTTTNNHDALLMLDRILRLLANYSVISRTMCSTSANAESERRYGLSRLTKFFHPDQQGASLGPLLALFLDKVVQDSCFINVLWVNESCCLTYLFVFFCFCNGCSAAQP